MPRQVELTDKTFGRLQLLAEPLVDTIETVVVKLADYWDHGHTSNPTPSQHFENQEQESEAVDQLPTKAFRIPLIEAIYECGGSAKRQQIKELLYPRLNPILGPGDRRVLASNRTPRWFNAVEFHRHKLVEEGLFKDDSAEGTWELTEAGIEYAESLIISRNSDTEQPDQQTSAPRSFDAKSVPSLRHTKLLSAKVGGQIIRPTWNGLLFDLIRRVPRERLVKQDEAHRFIIVNFVSGQKDDEGYRFVPELGISVQGQDANDAWKGASHIAQKLGVPVEVEFLWRMKEGAAFPGTTGRLAV